MKDAKKEKRIKEIRKRLKAILPILEELKELAADRDVDPVLTEAVRKGVRTLMMARSLTKKD